jgi:hypothetical protein
MKGRWQSILGAAIVALLVWLFAEGRSLITDTRSGAVVLVSPDGSRRVVWRLPDGGREFEISLTLSGSTAALDALARELQNPIPLAPGAELPGEVNDHVVNLADALRASGVFANRGVEILSVDPVQVRVRVDELVDREVRVTPRIAGAELDGSPSAAPDRVTVTLPQGLADQIITSEATLEAPVGPESLARRSGPITVTGVRVAIPPAWRAATRLSLTPETVDVTFTLRDTISETTLRQVPVYIAVPAAQQGVWEVIVPADQQYLRDVGVRGPSETIARIEGGEFPVVATVNLTPESLVEGPGSATASFTGAWPPTDSVEFTTATRRVEYELRRIGRQGPDAGPEGE